MHVRTPSVGTLGGLQTAPDVVAGPRREWRKPKPMMNGLKKSDEAVRPVRAANKGARASAESPEERASTKGNPDCQSTCRTQRRASVPQAAARIRKGAETCGLPSSTRGRSRMVQRPRPDLRGGCAAMRIPTATGSRGWATARGHPASKAPKHLDSDFNASSLRFCKPLPCLFRAVWRLGRVTIRPR